MTPSRPFEAVQVHAIAAEATHAVWSTLEDHEPSQADMVKIITTATALLNAAIGTPSR